MPSRFWGASGNALLPSANFKAVSGAVTLATLNPADMSGTGIALTNGNLTATTSSAAGTQVGVRATKAITGKVYWEAHVDNNADGWAMGVADATASFTGSYWGSGGNAHVSAPFASGNNVTHMFAVDKPNNLFWRGLNGVWTGDPVAGTGGTSISTLTGSVYPAFQGDNGDKCTANFGQTAYTYTVPSGYGNV
jgi:hypothetical protein